MGMQILLGAVGISLGFVVASGAVALIIGLGIIPRYAGLTKTADKVLLYENMCMLGAFLGNLAYLYRGELPLGTTGLVLYGICSGIFLGSWIVALGEVVNIFAILIRRLRLKHGLPVIILVMAVAKTLGSLLYFYKGWW